MKKGFTLIELLGVIIVIGIIAIISVPIVLNLIETSKKGAAKASALNYIEAVENYTASSLLDNQKEKLERNVDYQLQEKINKLVEIKGEKPERGYVILNEDYLVEKAEMIIRGYMIHYTKKDGVTIVDNEKERDGTAILNQMTFKETKELTFSKNLSVNYIIEKANALLDKMISITEDQMEIQELLDMKNESYTFTSTDPKIAKIKDQEIIAVSEGETVIIGTTTTGRQVKLKVSTRDGVYLSDIVKQGDYVDYNREKNNGISCHIYAGKGGTVHSGYRVAGIDKANHQVTLIHAGTPECYLADIPGWNHTTEVQNMNNFVQKYKNEYADQVRIVDPQDVEMITGREWSTCLYSEDSQCRHSLIDIDAYYWFASATDTSVHVWLAWERKIWTYVRSSSEGLNLGIRPVIVLKKGLKTNHGSGTESDPYNLLS